MSGKKSYLLNSQTKRIHVPRYKQLSMTKLLAYAKTKPALIKYFPDPGKKPEEPYVDRNFAITIVNTLEPEFIPQQIEKLEKERFDKKQKKTVDIIEVKTEIMDLLEAFQATRIVTKKCQNARGMSKLKKAG